jgi:hypothetical protein
VRCCSLITRGKPCIHCVQGSCAYSARDDARVAVKPSQCFITSPAGVFAVQGLAPLWIDSLYLINAKLPTQDTWPGVVMVAIGGQAHVYVTATTLQGSGVGDVEGAPPYEVGVEARKGNLFGSGALTGCAVLFAWMVGRVRVRAVKGAMCHGSHRCCQPTCGACLDVLPSHSNV